MADYGWIIAGYGAVAMFCAGVLLRIVGMMRMPVHLRWELAPVPGEGKKGGGSFYEEPEWWTKKRKKSLAAEMLFMGREIFFLHSVWRNNRMLWPFSYAFHTGFYFLVVYLLTLAALVAVMDSYPSARVEETVLAAASALGGIGYCLGSFGAMGLLALRLSRYDLRTYTSRGSFFNLGLCGAVLLSGLVSWSLGDGAGGITGFVEGLVTFAPVKNLPAFFALHLALTLFFIALLPYTQMIHFVMKFFTFHKVLWDDGETGASMERRVAGSLAKNMTWGAPHARGGARTWIDAVQEAENGEKNRS